MFAIICTIKTVARETINEYWWAREAKKAIEWEQVEYNKQLLGALDWAECEDFEV